MPGLVRARQAVTRLFAGNSQYHARVRTRSPLLMRSCLRLLRFAEWIGDYLDAARQRSERAAMEETRQYLRAKRRSLTLLLNLLSPAQREEFRRYRHFHVIGGETGTLYRIRVASFTNIDVIASTGDTMHHLCVHPGGDVPVYDVMAGQMLHLQDAATERAFLRSANVHPAVSQRRRGEWEFWMS